VSEEIVESKWGALKQIIPLFIVVIILMSGGYWIQKYDDSIVHTIEKDIGVIDKTEAITTRGLSSWTDYKILGDDGLTYHSAWEIYRQLQIGGTYHINANNLHGRGYASDYWVIRSIVIKDGEVKE
jgi:hypothetical protein